MHIQYPQNLGAKVYNFFYVFVSFHSQALYGDNQGLRASVLFIR